MVGRMSQIRLDPEHADAVPVTVKLGRSDAAKVTELATQAGVGKSAFIRSAVLREIEQRDTGPPEDGLARHEQRSRLALRR